MKTREFAIVCAVVVVLTGLVSPVAAEKGDKHLRFGVLSSMPTDDLVVGTQTTELDSAFGFGASFEFHVSDLIGIEPGLSTLSYDLTIVEPMFPTATSQADLLAVTTNVNFHFKQESGLDIFVGPTIGYALWDDLTVSGFATPVATDDEFLFGAHFGLDIPFGEGKWGFSTGLSYLALDLGATGGDIGVSPIQINLGVAYNF